MISMKTAPLVAARNPNVAGPTGVGAAASDGAV